MKCERCEARALRIYKFFTERVRDVEIVREVRRDPGSCNVTAWVITDGPRSDYESEEPIFKAVSDTLRYQDSPVFDFRIINMNDLPDGEELKDMIPTGTKTYWKRKNA